MVPNLVLSIFLNVPVVWCCIASFYQLFVWQYLHILWSLGSACHLDVLFAMLCEKSRSLVTGTLLL